MQVRHLVTVFNAADVETESAFWAALLGGTVEPGDEPGWRTVRDADGEPRFAVQHAPDHVPPAWPDGEPALQLHVDLVVDDLAAAHAQVVALGARLLRIVEVPDDLFHVYADPAGHPFCLVWSRRS